MSGPVILAAIAGACAVMLAAELTTALVARGGRSRSGSNVGSRLRWLLVLLGPVVVRTSIVRRLAPPGDLRARIVAAGNPGGLGVREWMSIKAAWAVGALLVSFPIAGGAPGRIGLLVLVCSPAAGFFVPDFWLGRAARTRIEAAIAELPDMLDLMRVSVEAGTSPMRALAAVAERFEGPLAREWARVAGSVALGAPAGRAFDELGDRLPDPQLRRFAETMRGASRQGLGMAEALAALASGARHAAHQQVRERAAKAGPKIQLVVALVLVPSAMLVIAAAITSRLAGADFS